MSSLDEINSLKKKKEEALTLLTKYRTQLESAVETRDTLAARLKDDFNVSPEEAPEKLEALTAERDELLKEAKEALDRINIKE